MTPILTHNSSQMIRKDKPIYWKPFQAYGGPKRSKLNPRSKGRRIDD